METDTKTGGVKLGMDLNSDEDQNCPICFDIWTNSGPHRLSSLKCGHLFGKSCIEEWLKRPKKKMCPQCKTKADKRDIRPIFASTLKALDTAERDREKEKIAEEKEKRLLAETQLKLMREEIDKLRKHIVENKKCKCGTDAVTRIVKKDNANKGRPFYSCMKPMNESCGFFEWADEDNHDSGVSQLFTNDTFNNNNRTSNRNSNDRSFHQQGNENSSDVKCKCGIDAVRRVTKKENANKGRPFYCCGLPMSFSCGFFEWADKDSGGSDRRHDGGRKKRKTKKKKV